MTSSGSSHAQWFDLPKTLQELFQDTFLNGLHLQAAFDTESEAVHLIEQFITPGSCVDSAVLGHTLFDWSNQKKPQFKRARTAAITSLPFHTVAKRDEAGPGEIYSELIRKDVTLSRTVAKSSLSRALQSAEEPPAIIETRMRELYALQLAEWIKEARLPVAAVMEATVNPSESWKHVFGKRRAKTLGNRLRSWKPVREWLLAVHNIPFPLHIHHMLDYLHDRCCGSSVEDTCGRSVPDSIAGALYVLETVGGVLKPISKEAIWINAVDSWKMQLQQGNTARRLAEILPISILLALEIYVCSETNPSYLRALGWLYLVMHWCTLRSDDCQGIAPFRSSLGNDCWQGTLIKSKTSGPGKKFLELPLYINRLANFSGSDWLLAGHQIWQSPEFSFPESLILKFFV
jgi:hypothetical protein